MTKAQLVKAPRPYPGIKQAKIATANAHAVATSSARSQISLIREGAPVETFAQTAKNVGLAQAEFAKKLGLSPRTLASRRTRLTPAETEKILRVKYLFEQAVGVFGSERSQALAYKSGLRPGRPAAHRSFGHRAWRQAGPGLSRGNRIW